MRTRALLLALLSLGCDAGDGAAGDASAPDGALDVSTPAPPIPPEPPRFDCPAGWDPVSSATLDLPDIGCDPWPEAGPMVCPDGWTHLPGRDECELVGAACPPSGFAPAPEGRVARYVAAGGPPGDGTAASPHGSIAEALEASEPGDVLLLGVGEHVEEVTLTHDVDLIGACAVGTVIRWGGPGHTLSSVADAARLSNLTLDGEGSVRASVRDGGGLRLESVIVRGAGDGVRASGSGTELVLSRVLVRSTPGPEIWAVAAIDGAAVEIADTEIRGAGRGLFAFGSGTTMTVTDSVVGALHDGADPPAGGSGAYVGEGASSSGARVVFDRVRGYAIGADGFGTRASFDQVWIEAIRALPGEPDAGAFAFGGAHVELRLASLVDVDTKALYASGEGSSLLVEDCAVDAVFAVEDSLAYGALAIDGGVITMRRAILLSAEHVGVTTLGGGLRLEDVRVAATLGDVGFGVVVAEGGWLGGARLVLSLNRRAGLYADGEDVRVTLTDLEVDRTRRTDDESRAGIGVVGGGGAQLELERVWLHQNVDQALQVFDPGTLVRMSDARIERTEPAGCVDEDCRAVVGGVGVGAYAGGRVELERFSIARHLSVGVQVAFGAVDGVTSPVPGSVALRDGEIVDNPIGLNVQSPAFDYDQLATVRFHGNAQNVTATELPVPLPAER